MELIKQTCKEVQTRLPLTVLFTIAFKITLVE